MSGVCLLPYILTCCLLSASIGKIVTQFGRYNEVITLGFAIAVCGVGLLYLLDENTSIYVWVLIQMAAGLGLGGNFQNMLIALQATIHHSDIAVATATFSFIVLLGATLGIAIGGTVFQNQMTRLAGDLPVVPGLQGLTGENAGAAVPLIAGLPDSVRGIVISNFAQSLKMVWVVLTAFTGAGFLASFAIGRHELYKEYRPLVLGVDGSIRTDQPAMMKKRARMKAVVGEGDVPGDKV